MASDSRAKEEEEINLSEEEAKCSPGTSEASTDGAMNGSMDGSDMVK